jgi:cell division protein FtsW
MHTNAKPDRMFSILTIILVVIGILTFISAALGVYASDRSAFFRMLASQLVLGVGGGSAMLYVLSRYPLDKIKQYALPFFVCAVVLTLMVFVPGIGASYGGATRWLSLGPISLQPSEFLKLGALLAAAAWCAAAKNQMETFKRGFLPLGILMAICAVVLLLQPDTDSFLLIGLVSLSIFIIAGMRSRYLWILIIVGILGAGGLVMTRPYLMQRFTTFLDASSDPTGASYHTRQARIAVGSGQVFGRGYGQSIQKFQYLPEASSDTIFAVYAEEFGFVGSLVLIMIYVAYILRGLKIARAMKDRFRAYLVFGIMMMIAIQALLNIASIVGLFPFSGLPLPFVSQGGTALLVIMASAGLVLNASRDARYV